MTTDNTQELDKAIKTIFNVNHRGILYYNHDIDDILDYQDVYDAKQAILDWHNKQTLELLNSLEQSFDNHTTPEGKNLLTRSYVRNTLNFERNKLNPSNSTPFNKLKESK